VAFAILDLDGRIVAVDGAWRRAASRNAAFGRSFVEGGRYADLCEQRLGRRGAKVASAVRSVLEGTGEEAKVVYARAEGGVRSSSEVRVRRLGPRSSPLFLVSHSDCRPAPVSRGETGEPEEQPESLARGARELIEARETALEAMRLRAEFAANLSHEIRTPMNGIIGMTDLVLETHLREDQREYLVAVRSAAQSLLALLSNMLDFSDLEAGRLALAEASFGLRESLDRVLRPLAARARDGGLGFSLELDPAIPERLVGDPERLGLVVHNIVDNAIKFTKRGKVTVRGLLERMHEGRALVRFDVTDTGCGIDPALHRKIFESFTQGDGSSTRRHGGTGLGLTIANQIAEVMGGRIRVESMPSRGSTFTFTLPFLVERRAGAPSSAGRRPADETARCGGSPPHPPGETPARTLRVLVAEDNPVAQRMARQTLDRLGHQVELVDNGRDAVHAARHGQVDLVLMDIELPVLDGFAATALIRESEKASDRHLPIVAVVGQETAPDQDRFRRAGMDDVLPKPLEAERLAALLSALETHPVGPPPEAAPPAVDVAHLLEQTGGDRELVADLAAAYVAERAAILAPIVDAIEASDPDRLEQAAHRLRGTFGTLAAPRAIEAARRLELIGRGGDLGAVGSALDLLRTEMVRLEAELQEVAGFRPAS
jgi:signal transduction histidine kinase/HPt (histidine-containing phosphotransfer) domain-containing protein